MKLIWSPRDCCKLISCSTWTFYHRIRPLFPPGLTQRSVHGNRKTFWTTDQVIAMMHHYYNIDDRSHGEIVRRVEEWSRPAKLTIVEDSASRRSTKRRRSSGKMIQE